MLAVPGSVGSGAPAECKQIVTVACLEPRRDRAVMDARTLPRWRGFAFTLHLRLFMKARLAALIAVALGFLFHAGPAFAQIVEFRATITPAQETSTVVSGASGTAVLLYDVTANTFDLFVTLTNFSNPLTLSHIHEGATGANGPVVTNLGAEAVYTRSGSTITGTFRNVTHGGAKLALLQGGAYLNFHTAAYPGGEIRGQLIAQPKRLAAIITPAQEVAANPVVSNAFGGALLSYDPGANRVLLQVTLFNFTNTLTASHFHEAAAGANGPVVTNLGGASAYTIVGGFVRQTFNIPYTGDPVKLLTGGAYLNFHSNAFGGGEIRGQVKAADEVPSSRLVNASSRGFVGTGSQVLITGFAVTGDEPVALRVIARGPSLASFGVQGVLSDPVMTLHNSGGLLMARNDNHALAAPSTIPALLDAKEAVLDVILPPGAYTAVVSGADGGTGVALMEMFEQRRGPDNTLALALMPVAPSAASSLAGAEPVRGRIAPEMCISTAVVAAVAMR